MSKMETIRNRASVVINMPGQPSIEVQLADLNDDITRQLTLHGLAQKLGDAAARLRNPDNGQPASWAEKYSIVRRVADALGQGDWTLRPVRVAADAITEDRVAAVARVRNDYPGRIGQWLETRTAEQRTAIFALPAVQVALASIRASRAAIDNDNEDALFAGLDTPEGDNTAPF